jgi:hypothetical protein
MIRRRVPWDGPDPKPGEYLTGRGRGDLWLIVDVAPVKQSDIDGERLLLELLHATTTDLPVGAVVHTIQRTMVTDPAGPPRVRQIAAITGGATAVMRASWRDPDDVRPNASRRPKEIGGYRVYCALRRMEARGSPIEKRHIDAADCLRLLWDLSIYGYSAELGVVAGGSYQQSAGPSIGQLAQAGAAREIARTLQRLPATAAPITRAIVIDNTSLAAWCLREAKRLAHPVDPKVEMGRLLVVLDILAEHFATEIEDARDDLEWVAAS